MKYSFVQSYGGVVAGSNYYYLANVSEFQMPKGISTFPDGGEPREVRQLFGLFRTDTVIGSTILVTKLGEVVGWPSQYSTRIDKNPSNIAIGIVNVTRTDSTSGIYLYNFKSNMLEKYSKEEALPALSENGLLIAYCIRNRLVIEDYSSKTTLFSYMLNFDPIFVTWKSDNEIYLFLSEPFSVKVLDFSTGKTSDTDVRYIKNFDQDVDIQKISKIFSDPSNEVKTILDKYY